MKHPALALARIWGYRLLLPSTLQRCTYSISNCNQFVSDFISWEVSGWHVSAMLVPQAVQNQAQLFVRSSVTTRDSHVGIGPSAWAFVWCGSVGTHRRASGVVLLAYHLGSAFCMLACSFASGWLCNLMPDCRAAPILSSVSHYLACLLCSACHVKCEVHRMQTRCLIWVTIPGVFFLMNSQLSLGLLYHSLSLLLAIEPHAHVKHLWGELPTRSQGSLELFPTKCWFERLKL